MVMLSVSLPLRAVDVNMMRYCCAIILAVCRLSARRITRLRRRRRRSPLADDARPDPPSARYARRTGGRDQGKNVIVEREVKSQVVGPRNAVG